MAENRNYSTASSEGVALRPKLAASLPLQPVLHDDAVDPSTPGPVQGG